MKIITHGEMPQASASILSHPAFDRPPVTNIRARGRKPGAVSLNARRIQRDHERADFAARARAEALVPMLDRAPASSVAPLPSLSHETSTIAAALAILDAKLREGGPVLDSPFLVKALLRLHLADRKREAFGVMFLDVQHQLLGFEVLFEGTLMQTTVHPREVVRRALELNAAAVILSHNHPSGRAEPSRADEYLTQTLKSALALVDVRVLDHIIVAGAGAASFAERGLL